MLACWIMLAFVAIVNIGGYFLVMHDKKQAQRHGSRAQRRHRKGHDRVPERTFHTLAVFGAGPGLLLGFLAVRHKTRKPRFMVPFVAASVLGIALVAAWLWLLC